MNQIVLTNYNLKEAEKIIICHCLENNKDKTLKELADLLHIAERTLYRFIVKNDLKHFRVLLSESRAIELLKKNGYTVEKIKMQ